MSDRAVNTAMAILQRLVGDYHPREFAVRLWDGTTWEAETGQPTRFTMIIRHPGALRRMFWRASEITMGEAYVYDDLDIEGEMEGAFLMAEYLFHRRWNIVQRWRFGRQLLTLPNNARPRSGRQPIQWRGRKHSKERDRQAVTYHYNVSNDFFALWVDRRMVYSCAYYTSPDEDLDIAQERKLDYICRKLRLRGGDRLLDIGCGWDALIIHAAQHCGVDALGITLSESQAELANKRIQ